MTSKLPIYLHLPAQIMWFTTSEVAIIVLFYLLAVNFGGISWLLLVIGPAVVIPHIRKQPRGYFAHLGYEAGFVELNGYPPATALLFNE